LLTADGGEDLSQLDVADFTHARFDYAKCYGFGVFVLLAVLPACWLQRPSPEGARCESPGRSPG
jgi:hypothetical protein